MQINYAMSNRSMAISTTSIWEGKWCAEKASTRQMVIYIIRKCNMRHQRERLQLYNNKGKSVLKVTEDVILPGTLRTVSQWQKMVIEQICFENSRLSNPGNNQWLMSPHLFPLLLAARYPLWTVLPDFPLVNVPLHNCSHAYFIYFGKEKTGGDMEAVNSYLKGHCMEEGFEESVLLWGAEAGNHREAVLSSTKRSSPQAEVALLRNAKSVWGVRGAWMSALGEEITFVMRPQSI